MNLLDLGSREARCKEDMDRAQGAVSGRCEIETWAQGEQREIHRSYSTLALGDSPESLEALKRALFLQWFECTEPGYMTGIVDLDADAALAIVGRVEKAFVEQSPDFELGQMVGYYLAVSDRCLDRYPLGPAKGLGLATASPPIGFLTSDSQRTTYPARGLMGNYFLSLRPPPRVER